MRKCGFQFQQPCLENIEFKLNLEFEPEESGFEMENSFTVEVDKNSENNMARVALTLNLNKNNNKAPFELTIKMASEFKWEKPDEEVAEELLKCNAPALLLSYMRPIVANIINSSGLPVYNLPFVDFTKDE